MYGLRVMISKVTSRNGCVHTCIQAQTLKTRQHRIIRTGHLTMEMRKKRIRGALRPVDHIRYAGKDLGSLGKFLTTNNGCNYREYASKLLKAEHEALQLKVIFSPTDTLKKPCTGAWTWAQVRQSKDRREVSYNDAVIALSCLYVEFVLQQEAGWRNWIAKAKKHLKRKQIFKLKSSLT